MAIRAMTAVRGTEGAQGSILNRTRPKLLGRMRDAYGPGITAPNQKDLSPLGQAVRLSPDHTPSCGKGSTDTSEVPSGGLWPIIYAPARKHPTVVADWRWQWVFPQKIGGRTQRQVSKRGNTWMNLFSRRPSSKRLKRRD